jgi:hypothetical protein
MRDLTLRVNRVIATTDDIVRQLTALQDQLRRAPVAGGGAAATPDSTPRGVLADVDSTIRDLRHFRDSVLARPLAGLGYRQYPRLREEVQTISGMIWRPLMPPTAGEMQRLGELKTETDDAQARLDAIIAGRVSRINQALAGTPHVITPQRTLFTPLPAGLGSVSGVRVGTLTPGQPFRRKATDWYAWGQSPYSDPRLIESPRGFHIHDCDPGL